LLLFCLAAVVMAAALQGKLNLDTLWFPILGIGDEGKS
jgi:hypothetical protein